MKKFLFLIITLLVVTVLVFFLYRVFFLQKNAKGALQITSSPESRVYLNDKEIGRTPLCICGEGQTEEEFGAVNLTGLVSGATDDNLLPTGEYTLRLVPVENSFPEFQEKITITQSVLTVVDRTFADGAKSEGSVITLEPLRDKNKTEILVLSIPDGSDVFLDSESIGKTPVTLPDVTESDHTLRLSKSGYKEKAVRIKTAKGFNLVAKIYLGIDQKSVTGREEPTASESAEAQKEDLTVSAVTILETGTGFLRVRDNASLSGSEVGRVTPGESYPLISEETDWYQIEYEEGKVGWISKQFAQKSEE